MIGTARRLSTGHAGIASSGLASSSARPISSAHLVTRTLLVACVAWAIFGGGVALARRGHVQAAPFGGHGSGPGQLDVPDGIAVNEEAGDVYVLDGKNNRVEYFTASGVYLGEFNGSGLLANEGSPAAEGQFVEPQGISVDNSSGASKGDVYVVDGDSKGPLIKSKLPGLTTREGGVIDKFSPTGEYLGQLTVPDVPPEHPGGGRTPEEDQAPTRVHGVTVDSKGRLWVLEEQATFFSHKGVDVFSSGTESTFHQLGLSIQTPGSGLAVSPGGRAYEAIDEASPIEPVVLEWNSLKESEGQWTLEFPHPPLEEPVGAEFTRPDGIGHNGLQVETPSEDLYIDDVTSVGRFNSNGDETERLQAGARSSAVAINSRSGELYVADLTADQIERFILEEPGPPTVEDDSVSGVTADSATLDARINPRGAATTYHFEVGACEAIETCAESGYERQVPVGEVAVGSDFEVYSVDSHVAGLVAAHAYHLRVVAANVNGSNPGPEQVFTTQPSDDGPGLPDGRRWEQVSPPDKHGALLLPIAEVTFVQASEQGDAVAYEADSPTEHETDGFANLVQVISERDSTGTWSSRNVTTPHELVTGVAVGLGGEMRYFSADLSWAIMQPFGLSFESHLSEQASEQTAYRIRVRGCDSGCARPLVTGCPSGEECDSKISEIANVPEGTQFGTACEGDIICGPVFVGASRNLQHIVVRSPLSLTGSASVKEGLYEWSEGALQLVTVLPNGKALPVAAGVPSLGGFETNRPSTYTRHAISEDGRRVVWQETGGEDHIYLFDSGVGKSVRLDAVAGGSGTGVVDPVFQAASADGEHVYFTDEQRLTPDSGAGTGAADLYECTMESGGSGPECSLEDLTPEIAGAPAEVRGRVSAVSEDGSYVYYVADEAVPGSGATRGTCGAILRPTDECNLYVEHAGTKHFIARLSVADGRDWLVSGGGLNDLTARTSPDGQWFSFMASSELTGYDNRDATSGHRDEEVYLYHAAANEGEGSLSCASCNPTNSRPHGLEYRDLSTGVGGLAGGDRVWANNQWVAASIPGWSPYMLEYALYDSRFLSDSGRLFFNSSDALVPADSNGTEDVYEFEPAGVGSCDTASPKFAKRPAGCLALISAGSSPTESAFLDASATGDDVFFLTAARLSSSDTDSAIDVYDAHVCSSGEDCNEATGTSQPPCETADACRGARTTQPEIFGPPASQTLSGSGNPPSEPTSGKPLTKAQKLAAALRVCRKRHRRAKPRRKCERQARASLERHAKLSGHSRVMIRKAQ